MTAEHVAQISDSDRIELVQSRHRSAQIPPLLAESVETRDILRIDRRLGPKLFVWGHGLNSIDLPRRPLHECPADRVAAPANADLP